MRESDGAVHTTYNPHSKWDWCSIGGRWEEIYRERQGEKVGDLRAAMEEALANMNDPAEVAKLDQILAEIAVVRAKFKEQRERAQAGEKIPEEEQISWQHLDEVDARKRESKAYMPWWFPYNIVLPTFNESVDTFDFNGNAEVVPDYEWFEKGTMGWWGMHDDKHSDKEWVEKVIERIKDYPEDFRVVYIDFHI